MTIGGVGYTSYVSNIPGARLSGSSAGQNAMQNAAPAASPIYSARNEFGPGVLYRNIDGDSVTLTYPRAFAGQSVGFNGLLPELPSAVPQQDIPVTPMNMPAMPGVSPSTIPATLTPGTITGEGINPESLIPEMPGSGLLDALKPEGECQTCANRKYVDGSDDPSVSYQSPTKINPSMAGVAVAAHEQEHVRNEQADAAREGRQVVNQSVTLHYDCCPECGKSYVSGGTTRTTTVGKKEQEAPAANAEAGGQAAKPDNTG